MSGFANDAKAQGRLRQREKVKRKQYDADLGSVMGTPEGRRLMWRLIDDTCGVYASSFTGNSQTFFNEGRRSIGLFLLGEAQRVAPADAVHMYQEQLQARREDELHRKDAEAQSKAEAEHGGDTDTGGD
jgi:hypothetical protein